MLLGYSFHSNRYLQYLFSFYVSADEDALKDFDKMRFVRG